MHDSEIIQALHRARSVAWAALRPAFDHAIFMARECEFAANQAAILTQAHTTPAYPPLVLLMAQAATTMPLSPSTSPTATPDGHRSHPRTDSGHSSD